ncbi:hypothetical protein Lesp02_56660 [Lentzea sp. NBRC 105346]|uniref:hypothetical protein n=1 Tax=Lentzea sp. NBRC 105346 TaxID=3032205 RepID=UPI0024A0E0B9|nr:hypothetical protein [Lentzea sp. NBRC 105346]GLZ33478.1 hypothetical protein Lesp02_56660 [Lentzea sp. NBRC 105346]
MSEEPPAAAPPPPERPAGSPQPAPEQRTSPLPPAGEPAPEQPAAAQQQPAPEQPAAQQPAPEYAAFQQPAAAAPRPRGERVRVIARHRATQLVAVGLLGLILGGGIVALLDRDGRGGPGFGPRGHDRPGHSRMDDRGHHDRWDR